MRFLFTCGGTAGHINPAVGVAGRLKELLPDAEILFIGARGKMETELVPREGFDIRAIEVDNLSRSFSPAGLLHNLSTAWKLVRGRTEARDILREFRPDAAIGTGGYVCYPVLRSAHALGIPTLVHESNAVPGLTTRLLSRRVDCVMVGFADAAENYPAGVRVEVTGTPVRREFRGLDKAAARRALGLPEDRPLVVSVWGSLGSGHINGLMPEFFRRAAADGAFQIIHSAGKRGYEDLKAAAEKVCGAPDLTARGVDYRPYIFDMPRVMAAADLVMCRSGASTLAELSALGRPALLIPSPNVTNHHQEKNARLMERSGGAAVLLEGQFDAGTLYDTVKQLVLDRPRLDTMAGSMKAVGTADAENRIADLILDYVK